jgi:hypothetical protein
VRLRVTPDTPPAKRSQSSPAPPSSVSAPGAAEQDIRPAAAVQRVVPRIAIKEIVTNAAQQVIVPAVPLQPVVAVIAGQQVVDRITQQPVVAAKVFHSFRHSVAYKLENAGVMDREVQRMLGHKIGKISFDTYNAQGLGYEALSKVVAEIRWPAVEQAT